MIDPFVAAKLDEMRERVDQIDDLIRTWRIALLTIANGDDGQWGRIALEALDKEKRP
jgi:PHP family Zn ribbon phosphoesterase